MEEEEREEIVPTKLRIMGEWDVRWSRWLYMESGE